MKNVGVGTLLIGLVIASLRAENFSPYSYMPEQVGKFISQDVEETKPIIEVLPHRPMLITDSKGNKMFATKEGKVMLTIDNKGNKTFFSKGLKVRQEDSKGNLTKTFNRIKGTNKVIVKNEWEKKIGSEELGLGNKVVKEFDEKGNIKMTYGYNRYGKTLKWVMDELTQKKTICDDKGNSIKDVNFEGFEIASYERDEKGKLLYKEDVHGNKTFYDEYENSIYTEDVDGSEIATFNYKTNDDGYKILFSVEENGITVTYFDETGKQTVTKNLGRTETTLREWTWHGTELLYTFDAQTKEITWYENGRPTKTTYDGNLTSEWFYIEGVLAGKYNFTNAELTLYQWGREKVSLYYPDYSNEEVLEVLLKCKI